MGWGNDHGSGSPQAMCHQFRWVSPTARDGKQQGRALHLNHGPSHRFLPFWDFGRSPFWNGKGGINSAVTPKKCHERAALDGPFHMPFYIILCRSSVRIALETFRDSRQAKWLASVFWHLLTQDPNGFLRRSSCSARQPMGFQTETGGTLAMLEGSWRLIGLSLGQKLSLETTDFIPNKV